MKIWLITFSGVKDKDVNFSIMHVKVDKLLLNSLKIMKTNAHLKMMVLVHPNLINSQTDVMLLTPILICFVLILVQKWMTTKKLYWMNSVLQANASNQIFNLKTDIKPHQEDVISINVISIKMEMLLELMSYYLQ